MRFSLGRSLRRVRSSVSGYQALSAREPDEASRESYCLLADHQRRREARKLTSLFNLGARLPANNDPLAARVWRWLLVLCGPKVAIVWIDWRDAPELAVIIVMARVVARIADIRDRHMRTPTV